MIEYYTLPLNDLKQIAHSNGIELIYHPLQSTISKDGKTVTATNRKDILRVILNWDKQDQQ